MKANLQVDFSVDKPNSALLIKREFRAEKQLVWDCYTQSELLDQWFAVKPMTTKTKSMVFEEGGHWHYAMVEPNGIEHWGYTHYISIKPIDFYTATDAFSNEQGEINKAYPSANWQVTFIDKGANTLVESVITYNSLADLEAVVQMGMEQGIKSTLERLDELLEKLV